MTLRDPLVGADAVFLHLERPDTPMHTLKVLELEPTGRGTVTLPEIAQHAPAALALCPRLAQRLGRGPDGREHWQQVEELDVAEHLDEIDLGGAASAADLDGVCADLAKRHLDRSRPLWALTLVHGLAHGRQAVVIRVHHAIVDGLAAINLFNALSTDERRASAAGASSPVSPASPKHGSEKLDRAGRAAHIRSFAAAARASRERTRAFGKDAAVPRGLAPRTPLNTPSGAQRLCASIDLSLADIKGLARLSGTTLNGAFHGLLAQTLREEFLAQGSTPVQPLIGAFGVAESLESDRFHGNAIATSRVWLHSEEPDPATALTRTAHSCARAVERRRAQGFELHRASMGVLGRVFATVRAALAHRTPLITNHVTTANVPGPRTARWFGDVRVTRLISFSLAIAPVDVNLTAYSYDGRFTIGLVTTPESMADPAGFLRRMESVLIGFPARLLGATEAQFADIVGS